MALLCLHIKTFIIVSVAVSSFPTSIRFDEWFVADEQSTQESLIESGGPEFGFESESQPTSTSQPGKGNEKPEPEPEPFGGAWPEGENNVSSSGFSDPVEDDDRGARGETHHDTIAESESDTVAFIALFFTAHTLINCRRRRRRQRSTASVRVSVTQR